MIRLTSRIDVKSEEFAANRQAMASIVEDLRANWIKDKEWHPVLDAATREKEYALWKKAVTRTCDWAE